MVKEEEMNWPEERITERPMDGGRNGHTQAKDKKMESFRTREGTELRRLGGSTQRRPMRNRRELRDSGMVSTEDRDIRTRRE